MICGHYVENPVNTITSYSIVDCVWNVMTRAETRFRLSAKRTSPFKSAGASVKSTTGSRGVRISGSNAGYTMFRGSVQGTGYPLHWPVSPSLPLPCVTVCHHISTGLYNVCFQHSPSFEPSGSLSGFVQNIEVRKIREVNDIERYFWYAKSRPY